MFSGSELLAAAIRNQVRNGMAGLAVTAVGASVVLEPPAAGGDPDDPTRPVIVETELEGSRDPRVEEYCTVGDVLEEVLLTTKVVVGVWMGDA